MSMRRGGSSNGRGCSKWSARRFPTPMEASGAGIPTWRRALGVNNVNESAGGFAGLGTILWLAPLAVVTRGRSFPVAFLGVFAVSGALGAFRLPPIDNLLRALPVLDVTDNRRLTLWVSFALVILGGIGLDVLAESRRLAISWIALWVLGAALLGIAACGVGAFEGPIKERASRTIATVRPRPPGLTTMLTKSAHCARWRKRFTSCRATMASSHSNWSFWRGLP